MRHRISRDAVDASRCIHGLDAVNAAQLLRRNLTRSSFFSWTDRGEGEHAAGADPEDAADKSLFAHAHSDNGIVVGFASQKLNHRNIVGKRRRSTDDFVEVRREGAHLLQGFVQLLGSAKIVERKNQRRAGTQFLQLRRFALLRSLQFHIYQLTSNGRSLGQNIQFRRYCTAKSASVGHTAAGSDDGGPGMRFDEMLDLRKRQRGLRNVV